VIGSEYVEQSREERSRTDQTVEKKRKFIGLITERKCYKCDTVRASCAIVTSGHINSNNKCPALFFWPRTWAVIRHVEFNRSISHGHVVITHSWQYLMCTEPKVHPITGHEGPEREKKYSSILSLTSTVDGCSQHNAAGICPEKDPVPIVQEAGWTTGPCWTGTENLAVTRFRFADRPARGELPYRLRCPWLTRVICTVC